MRIISWEDLVTGRKTIKQKTAVTIGVFDGVHIGHQRLLDTITAGRQEGIPCVVTFTTNPALVIKKKKFPGNILSLNQKLTKLELFGIQLVILIDFSYEFSTISGEEFRHSLFKNLNVYKLAVGRNFHFGQNRKSGIKTLFSISPGINLDVVDPVFFKGEIVSSTRIRRLLKKGRFGNAEAMVGTKYQLDMGETGRIRLSCGKGEIDLHKHGQVIPERGHYSVVLVTESGEFPCNLGIENGMACWSISGNNNADYTKIKYITFIKRS